MTQQIDSITLLVPDYDAGIRLYDDVLGFDLLEDAQLSPSKRWVRVAAQGAQTALLLAKADTRSRGPRRETKLVDVSGFSAYR
jgi:catechol 2,3-dioxygenase-like lactoylglutathione lyase family enzyme